MVPKIDGKDEVRRRVWKFKIVLKENRNNILYMLGESDMLFKARLKVILVLIRLVYLISIIPYRYNIIPFAN